MPSNRVNNRETGSNVTEFSSQSNIHKLNKDYDVKSCSRSINNVNFIVNQSNNFATNAYNNISAKDVSQTDPTKLINNTDNNSKEDINENETQLYFKRWIVLAVFCLITLLNAFNWIEYSIIQDVVIEFYNASLPVNEAEKFDAVNWFSMVYMLCYIPLVFPTMFLLDRKGLKLSCVLGALLTAVGAAGMNIS